MTDYKMKKWEIKSLLKARKDLCEEVGKWHWYYTVEWFIGKMQQIDTRLHELTGIFYIHSTYKP